MKRRAWLIVGLAVLSFVLANVVACSSSPAAPPVATQAPESPSCVDPAPEMAANCAALADRVLASTVRLEFHGSSGGIGHATVIGGRYLVTHNHYPVSGEALSRGGDGLISAVSVLKANGDVILLKAPLAYFSAVLITPETLVLDFHEYSGVGFFDSLGVASAEPGRIADLNLQPGSEVAQIDWDLTTTRVIWARITAAYVTDGAPCVELDSYVEKGASGGGVFYKGVHIANNQSRNTDRIAATGEVVRQYSVAALNSESVLALRDGVSEVVLADQGER